MIIEFYLIYIHILMVLCLINSIYYRVFYQVKLLLKKIYVCLEIKSKFVLSCNIKFTFYFIQEVKCYK